MQRNMEAIEKKLITWYELDDPSKRDFVFTRHSSARQPEVTEGVCDYRLYSIREKDADMLLYNTVWDLITHPDFYGFYEDVDVLNSSVVFEVKGGGVTWYRPYLLFPADDPCIDFHKRDMNYPYIVGAFSEFDDFYGGEAGLIEEGDGGPIFRDYYVPEWSFNNGEPEVVYREHKCGNEVSMPRIYDNEIELRRTIYELLNYIDTVHANVGVWKERLQMAHEMIKTHANELHILHNAGIYDIETLWTVLIDSDHDNGELRKYMMAMNREIHRYAMMAVNLIDWKKGGFNKDGMLYKSELPNAQIPKGRYDDVKILTPAQESKGYDWDNVYPQYPVSKEGLTEPSYVRKLLPIEWWNNLGAMEKAFDWNAEERRTLDRALKECKNGPAFGDDMEPYVEALRTLVRNRLKVLALEEYEANRKEWLFNNSR